MVRNLGIIPLLALGACANTADVRALSDSTGVYVSSLSEGTADFLESQSRLNNENEAHLQAFRAFTSTNRAEIVQQHLAWSDAADARRIDTFGRAASVSANDVVDGLHVTSVKPAQLTFGGADGYGEASSALGQISKGPSLLQAIKGLLDYGGEVIRSYEDLQKTATETTDETTKATAAADKKGLADAAGEARP